MAEVRRNLPRPAQSHPPRTSFVSNAGMLASGAARENLLLIVHEFSILVGLFAELFKGRRQPMILCSTLRATLAQAK